MWKSCCLRHLDFITCNYTKEMNKGNKRGFGGKEMLSGRHVVRRSKEFRHMSTDEHCVGEIQELGGVRLSPTPGLGMEVRAVIG